jgi:hypothetical protein
MLKFAMTTALALGLSITASAASAENRLVDGVLGAGAGALVAGPVGLVAGGVIGYSSGPGISCTMRDDCHRRFHHHHHLHHHS